MLKLFLSFLRTFSRVFQYLKASCHLYNEIKTNSEIFQERKVDFYQTVYHKKFVVILNRGRGTDEKSFYEWKLDLANNFNGLYIQFGKVHFLQLTEFYGHQFFEYIFFFELFFIIHQFYEFWWVWPSTNKSYQKNWNSPALFGWYRHFIYLKYRRREKVNSSLLLLEWGTNFLTYTNNY